MQWTTESLTAAAAVIITLGGGIITTAMHYGAVNDNIAAIEKRVDSHDKSLATIEANTNDNAVRAARIEQRLSDVKESLDRIEANQHASARPAH